MKKHLLLLLAALLPVVASAYSAKIDGIYYNFSGDEAEVTYRNYDYNSYSGTVSIPKSVTYNSKTYSVTSIGNYAFKYCRGLTSITIPNSVTSIGYSAFDGCTSLTSITIPNSATSIGYYAFSGCSSLTSITIPNSVTIIGSSAFQNCTSLTSVTIPNSVISIGSSAFSGCAGLTFITIPNSVTSIGNRAFDGCSSLTSITIPNSVTSIGNYAFEYCRGLTSVTIPNSVTSIGNGAFRACTSLTSITIPNSVTSIGDNAFSDCSGLTSVTIPNSVTSIGNYAFAYCSGLTEVYCLAESVPQTNSEAFYSSPIASATLHVPASSVNAYKTTAPWSNFGQIVAINAIKETCTIPTISYANGKLTFNCETEDVIFHSTITDTDITSYLTQEVELCVTYTISVYASKPGYEDSEVATGTLCWIDQQPNTEGIVAEDAVTEVKALPVLIQSNGGTITVQGANEGTEISAYSVNGMKQGSAIATQGLAAIETTLRPGSVAVVKIGDKAVKVLIK